MNQTRGLPRILAALFCAVLWATPAQAEQANPADVASIDAIILAAYDVISGDAGVQRDWQRWHSLFAPGATLSAVSRTDQGYQRRILSPENYAETVGPNLEANGFHEIEIHRVTEQYGQIAHAFSTYESRNRIDDAQPSARGINSFQLMNDGERWWIVSIYWQGEGESNPIPEQYLP